MLFKLRSKKFSHFVLIFGLVALSLASCQNDPVNYLNESKTETDERMAWWRDARFGMFIHWGLYAVPAGEWNGETNHAEWIRTTAQVPLEEYDQLVDKFNPVQFDANEWVRMAREAGMKYIVITSKHHDGFCLFDSEYTDFDIMSTPFKRDIMKELAEACRKEGMKMCWYHSIMDWHHPDYLPRRGWETARSAEGADMDRYIRYMKSQLKELVENYGDIGVLWFDGEWETTWNSTYGSDLYNYVRNLQPDIIINNRVDIGRSGMAGLTRKGGYAGDFGTPEQEIPATGLPGVDWETCMTMNNHWGYNKNDDNWKSPTDLIRKLADINSKGGNFLLNVGPTAKGVFPEESIDRLLAIGQWMKINSESVHGTEASPFKKLPWGRCTQKQLGENTRLYLHVFNWPTDTILHVPGIFNDPIQAYLLADTQKSPMSVSRIEDALLISLPASCPNTINTVVVFDITGKPDISYPPVINSDYDIFVNEVNVEILTDRDNVTIHYTLDQSIPTSKSPLYKEPLEFKETTLIVARSFRDGIPVSDTISKSFVRVVPTPGIEVDHLFCGIEYQYYEGEWDSLPAFQDLDPVSKGIAKQLDVTIKEQDDYYGVAYDGYIDIEETGIYEFLTDSDDGSQLYIDGQLIVDNDGLHGMEMKNGVIALSQGYHRIRVTYFERTGGDELNVYIDGPSTDRQIIPSDRLYYQKN